MLRTREPKILRLDGAHDIFLVFKSSSSVLTPSESLRIGTSQTIVENNQLHTTNQHQYQISNQRAQNAEQSHPLSKFTTARHRNHDFRIPRPPTANEHVGDKVHHERHGIHKLLFKRERLRRLVRTDAERKRGSHPTSLFLHSDVAEPEGGRPDSTSGR